MTKIEVENLKMLRETLCVAQGLIIRSDDSRRQAHSDRLADLIRQIDEKRPLGSDGKHGNLHTPECGCEDKPTTGVMDLGDGKYRLMSPERSVVTGRFNATKNVLADRERELLDLKGPCSNKACTLHYAHYGPCGER